MIATHVLYPGQDNRSGFIAVADVVELLETFTGHEVRGLTVTAAGVLRLDLDAPLTAQVRTDGGHLVEGRIEHLRLRVGNGLPVPTPDKPKPIVNIDGPPPKKPS